MHSLVRHVALVGMDESVFCYGWKSIVRVTNLLLLIFLAGVLNLGSTPAVAYDVAGMRGAMQSVFTSMRTLLELSADTAQLAEPANQAVILQATAELEEQANLVSAHVPRDEISFLASSLDRYAQWIRKSYQWRLYNDTRQLVHATVDVCVACHTRLTSRRDSPLAEDFVNSAQMSRLSLRQSVRLQTATRRFDDALQAYETLLVDSVEDDDFLQLARDALVLALRVKANPHRARELLAQLLTQEGLQGSNREHVAAWLNSLQELSKVPVPEGDLDIAQVLVEQAESVAVSPATDPLVNYIVASRLLYDYLEGDDAQGKANAPRTLQDGSKAYYLMGLTQYRIEPESWLPQAELFLEKSIRTAPASAHARDAFNLLLHKMQRTYPSEKGGIPKDVHDHLQILLDMVRAAG